MDNEDDIQRLVNGSNGVPSGDSSVSYERLNKVRYNLASKIDSLSCDQANVEEMMMNIQAGRPIWYDLYEDEKDWLEWGYPWVKKYLDETP